MAEYFQYEYRGAPLFRTVGLDQTFYRPPSEPMLAHYAQQTPPGFEICSKVWEEITVPQFPNLPQYGIKAGRPNPRFLDPELFQEAVLSPHSGDFRSHTGPFIFEFQRTGIEPDEFLGRLDQFLARLPKDFRYAVEIRNAALLGPTYAGILKSHGVAHCYNHWTYMPPLASQHERLEQMFTAPFTVFRLLTPIGLKYQDAVKRAEPYNKIVQPLPQMRTETVQLIKQAASENRRSYVLVNNRSEGSAPLTVQALVDLL